MISHINIMILLFFHPFTLLLLATMLSILHLLLLPPLPSLSPLLASHLSPCGWPVSPQCSRFWRKAGNVHLSAFCLCPQDSELHPRFFVSLPEPLSFLTLLCCFFLSHETSSCMPSVLLHLHWINESSQWHFWM